MIPVLADPRDKLRQLVCPDPGCGAYGSAFFNVVHLADKAGKSLMGKSVGISMKHDTQFYKIVFFLGVSPPLWFDQFISRKQEGQVFTGCCPNKYFCQFTLDKKYSIKIKEMHTLFRLNNQGQTLHINCL
jgi:hypothetical protein